MTPPPLLCVQRRRNRRSSGGYDSRAAEAEKKRASALHKAVCGILPDQVSTFLQANAVMYRYNNPKVRPMIATDAVLALLFNDPVLRSHYDVFVHFAKQSYAISSRFFTFFF